MRATIPWRKRKDQSTGFDRKGPLAGAFEAQPKDLTIGTDQLESRILSGLEQSILGKLPFEIVRYIRRFLCLDSAVCFALTCRSIYTILGTWHWARLKPPFPSAEYRFLLTLLSKDLPDYIFCRWCRILHTVSTHRVLTPYGRVGRALQMATVAPINAISLPVFSTNSSRWQ
jgi:hypothetical protein